MDERDPLVDFKALASGILEKDRTIRERVPGHVDSLEIAWRSAGMTGTLPAVFRAANARMP